MSEHFDFVLRKWEEFFAQELGHYPNDERRMFARWILDTCCSVACLEEVMKKVARLQKSYADLMVHLPEPLWIMKAYRNGTYVNGAVYHKVTSLAQVLEIPTPKDREQAGLSIFLSQAKQAW